MRSIFVLCCGMVMGMLLCHSPLCPSGNVPDFFAPARTSGSLSVKLYPMENVTEGQSVLVTFGVPFARNSMDRQNLDRVRLLRQDGAEVAAHVSQLAAWRNAADEDDEGSAVRVVMIQIQYTFAVKYPDYETVTLQWGGERRQADVSARQDPLRAWHLVTEGSFNAADNVYEPDVYAVLPREYMCQGSLKLTRMLPFDYSVPEQPEEPEKVAGIGSWEGYQAADHAQHNFFFSLLNDKIGDGGKACPYKSHYEPWLYDRATAMYVLYMRSGYLHALRQAVRHTQFYRNKLWDDNTRPERFIGLFKLKVPSATGRTSGNAAMYSYNQCLAYYYWLTGEASVLPQVEWVARTHELNDEPTRWGPDVGFWTERHTAFRLLANTVAYEVTGKEEFRLNLNRQYRDFIWHQDGAGGALPADRVDGALWHSANQHGDGQPGKMVASSWMTVLTVDAMLRAFALTGDPAIGRFIKRVGNFEKAACKLDSDHSYGNEPLWYCDYMVRHDGASEARHGSMVEHSLEIAATVAWAAYFSAGEEEPDTSLVNLAARMYQTYEAGVFSWVRPTRDGEGPLEFQMSPWRKYGWQYVPSGSFSWLMETLVPK